MQCAYTLDDEFGLVAYASGHEGDRLDAETATQWLEQASGRYDGASV